jgi:hypothetical protein
MTHKILSLSCLLTLALPAGPAAGELAFAFGETSVGLKGMTPGDEVLVYTLARVPQDGMTIVSDETHRLTDADGDGQVTVDLGKEVPWRSLWIAFELSTGAYAVDQASIGVREVDFSELGTRSGSNLEYRTDLLYAFVARAQAGAWRLRAGEGGPNDSDGVQDGKITLQPGRLRALADSPAPPAALAGQDLVVIIDPRRMKYAVVPREKQ